MCLDVKMVFSVFHHLELSLGIFFSPLLLLSKGSFSFLLYDGFLGYLLSLYKSKVFINLKEIAIPVSSQCMFFWSQMRPYLDDRLEC